MRNATGKESMRYDAEELRAQAKDSQESGRPAWVVRGALEQAEALENSQRTTAASADSPVGTMIRSNFTGMVLVRLRYYWVNLNDSVRRVPTDLDYSEWTLTHRPVAEEALEK